MRTNGFEKPFSRDQATSWIIQLTLIGSFITFVSTLLSWEKCLAILLPNAALVITVVTAWSICESRDPAKNPRRPSFHPSCEFPIKSHESNYEAFYCLVVSATCQTLLQTVIGILMCTLWQSEVKANASDGWDKAVIALLWIHNAACLSLTNSFVLLAGFHTYLLCVGIGTYDFILANGSDGLCTRMLKCNCLRRSKSRNRKRSHVQHGDVDETKSAKGSATRSRRGSPPAAITPASLAAPSSSLRSQTSLEQAAVAAALEVSRNSERAATTGSRDQSKSSRASINPTEIAGSVASSTQPDMVLSVGVNESEGIFEEVDLSSPPKPKKSSGTVVAPATMTES
ncbi:hypothetical protein PF006_g8216 [Phytophthora fragariae]|uniref:Transmembrane protein n=1 Tax=Phytophthora fragariae TaxID=53985 RepID=A0A6A3U689_9STRA|nr:hypothetical protein PF006_g8216 [Phytophthora fragariae]